MATLFALLLFGSACSDSGSTRNVSVTDSVSNDSIAREKQDSINRTLPGYVIDSILPADEEIRRFRNSVGGAEVTEFSNSTRSREALVARFRRALESGDTAAFQSMVVTPREFIDLVYPESRYTIPPYRQSPALVWQQIQSGSTAGLSRLLARMGGVRTRGERHACEKTPEKFGKTIIYSQCTVAAIQPDGTVRQIQLFGPIIERDGRFKFVSYANQF